MQACLVNEVYETTVQSKIDPFEVSVAKGPQHDPNHDSGTILLSFKAEFQMLA